MKSPVKFGKYYLLERVNVGGMAEVFKAKSFGEAGFERLVAVKRILPSIAEDQEFIAMFIDEAKLAVQLTHPNIAQIFELGKVGEAYFIALEYVPGKDLRAMFDRARKRTEPMPIPMACYMTMKICEGLDYAHNKKDAAGRSLELVHRDVSPQNMLISWDGDVKLIDFGIAKAASKSSKTQAGILKGKFGYMSPEQVRGLQIDRRSDIFAVGIVLYELLTMERLFIGESDFSTLEKVRNVEIMPPSTYNRKIPEELEQIVLKALAKHPEDRYRTAMDLHDDLQSFMYTSGNFFARKDLSAFMHRVFQDEIAKEAAKDDEYRKFDSRRASDLEVFDGATAPPTNQSGRNAPPPPPPPRSSTPPPPPPQARVSKPTLAGVGPHAAAPAMAVPRPTAPVVSPGPSVAPAASVAPSPRNTVPGPGVAPAAAAAAAQGLEMDWDDEELATQVYDRPDGFPGNGKRLTATPSYPGPNGHAVPTKSVPPPPPNPAAYANARAQTIPMPAAGIPAPKSLPAIPAPALPPAKPPAVHAPMPPSMMVPAVSAPMVAPPKPMPYSSPFETESIPSIGVTGLHRRRPIFMYAVGGTLAVIVGVAVALKVFRGDPDGTLDISTNVPGVTLFIDAQPQPGNGTHFMVPGLSATSRHRVMVRRDGYLSFQQDVPVRGGEVTAMQIALVTDPALAPAPPPPAPVVAPVVQAAVQPVAPPTPTPAPPPEQQTAPPPTTTTTTTTTTTAQTQSPPATQSNSSHSTSTSSSARSTNTQSSGSSNNSRRTASNSSNSTASRPREQSNSRTETSASTSSGGGTGVLLLSTRPAATCSVGGHSYSTPHRFPDLAAGTYRVSCQNAEFNVSANFTVTIRAGQDTRDLNHPLN